MKKASKEPGDFCPLIQGECVGWKCMWYTHLRGSNPNTGQEVDHEGCSIAFLPMLLVENAQVNRQTGAAVESFRNESVKRMDIQNGLAQTFTALAVSAQNRNQIPHRENDIKTISDE